MQKLSLITILCVGLILFAENAYSQNNSKITTEEPETTSKFFSKSGGVKNVTASGRYYGEDSGEKGRYHGGDDESVEKDNGRYNGGGRDSHEKNRDYDRSHRERYDRDRSDRERYDRERYDRDRSERDRYRGDRPREYFDNTRIYLSKDVPLVDDYICDLDASVLVVTNSDEPQPSFPADPGMQQRYPRTKRGYSFDYPGRSYYGREYSPRDYFDGPATYGRDPSLDYNPRPHFDYRNPHFEDQTKHFDNHLAPGILANADRLRCSVIASDDQGACSTCCQLSARKDQSISKTRVVGFLVDSNQLTFDVEPAEGSEVHYNRNKRSSDDSSVNEMLAAVPVNRCLCCAPKIYRPFLFDRYFRRFARHPYHSQY